MIDSILQKAFESGRNMLYEHEVYSVLECVGIDVPDRVFITDPSEVDEKLLSGFRSPFLMLKTVSRDMAHNQKFGGVRKVAGKDPLFVQFVLTRMREEVLSHFDDENKPVIDGFLIIEFVKFTQALGNEIMIGLKEDLAFGSVTTLTKGGDDAEFFAKYYDPANLSISPVTPETADEIVEGLKIRHKYLESGNPGHLRLMSGALTALSMLGHEYSAHADEHRGFHIRVLDVNPIVFAEDGRFIAIDGYAEFVRREIPLYVKRKPNIGNLEKFFAPEGIAVFGVSSDISKYSMAKVIVSLFLELGRDEIYCVNPKGGSAAISGHEFKLYKDFSEIPGTVDLIVYAAPAKNTLLFLNSIPEDKAIVLISGMPPEIDYGGFLKAVAERKSGIRLIGPNCMGVYNAPSGDMKGVNTLFIDERKLRISYSDRSNTALATQSGAMGITMIERNQYSAILRTIVSFGNKADVDIPDLLAYLLARDDIDVVSLYIEGLNELEGRQFYELAASSDKTVIVYKSGRTEAGAKAAASHTASMSGSYDVFKAACEQAGCILTEELDDFYNLTKVFAMLSSRIVRGQRVAGVVNAGLDATMGADTIYFLQQAVLDRITIERISALNKQGFVDIGTSFLDVTPMTDDKAFAEYVRAVLADDNVDCMFIAIVPHIENLKTSEEDYMDPDAIAVLLSDIIKKTDKPVVISVNAGSHYQNLVSYFEVNGIPVFPDIHAAIRSLDRFVKYRIQ